METLLIKQPDPKQQARHYLRLRGVAYNDLITGDHAAQLLADWANAVMERDEHVMKLMHEFLETRDLAGMTVITEPKEGE